jgi:hypothetical protein
MTLLLLQLACSGSDADTGANETFCPTDGAVSVAITSPLPTATLTSDLLVQGEAHSESGVALVGVSIAGVSGTSTLGNYATWTATVPYTTMLAMTGGLGGEIRLCPSALDLCGNQNPPTCSTITVGIAVGDSG